VATLIVNGDSSDGAYAVGCSCGQTWRGQARGMVFGGFNPAMPVAEAVVHVRLAHPSDKLALDFSPAFSRWLEHYWEQVNRDFQAQLQR